MKKHTTVMIVVFVVVITVTLSLYSRSRIASRVSVVFLDVGQGDAMLITSPLGRQVLIDGGASSQVLSGLRSQMSLFDKDIDMVIATHADQDHVGGLVDVIRNYDVQTVGYNGLDAGGVAFREFARTVDEFQVPVQTLRAGSRIRIDRELYLEVLFPYEGYIHDDANEHSLVMRLVYGDTSLLLTGDVGVEVEQALVDIYGNHLQSDVLKLGHHGSKTSSSSVFLDIVDPEYAVVSASCDNRFGHPHGEVTDRVRARDIEIYETCREGDVVFESDGVVWLKK